MDWLLSSDSGGKQEGKGGRPADRLRKERGALKKQGAGGEEPDGKIERSAGGDREEWSLEMRIRPAMAARERGRGGSSSGFFA